MLSCSEYSYFVRHDSQLYALLSVIKSQGIYRKILLMARKNNGNSLFKVIVSDLAGIGCLLLVPLLGPLPGPGGIPLILAGLGFLAVNHDWADNAIHYVKKHSTNLRRILFPAKKSIELMWDIFAILLLGIGFMANISGGWLLKALSVGLLFTASTILIMNRKRMEWLDKNLRRFGKK